MSAGKGNLPALYAELSRAGENGEFDKALKVVNKLLQENEEDDKVYHCKAVCLIHLGEFDEAYKLLESKLKDFRFEKAYCLYRLNRIQEAFNVLKTVSNPETKVKELTAQVLYRLEKYEDSYEMYRELIKNSEDDYEEERETNLAAVVANLHLEKGKDFKKVTQLREHTYELCYNQACILIAQQEYEKAIEKLKTAEELCKKTLEENDVPEEEFESEMGVIHVQIGYALQMLKKSDRALKIYNQVLKKRPSDNTVIAVASNNVITINKDQNVFDSKKKMKVATAENLDSKLTSQQRQSIAINNCLLLLSTNQMEACKRQIQSLAKRFPSSAADVALLQAALYCKEKKVQKAVDVLKEYAANHPEQSVALSFTLAQLLLTQGHVSQACETLRSMKELSYTPGILSALVTLFLSLENKEAASNVLREAISWYKKNMPNSPTLNVIMREAAKMELKNGHPKEAAILLEELRRNNPGDLKALAQLISAYSQFDPQKAKKVSQELPPVSEASLNIDVDNLESTSWTMGVRYIKKGGKAEISSGPKSGGSNDAVILKKRKKKRKPSKLPKNYDPNVDPDPERWLPKRERSTFKKKKDKRGAIGKGTQGAVAGTEESTKTSTNLPSPASAVPTANSPNVQGPRQNKNQKKKKKGKW